MSHFDLVIFDCDGVLVDSEPITICVLTQMLNEIGASLTVEETMHLYVGKSLRENHAITRQLLGGDLPQGFYDTFVARRDAALIESIQPVAHVAGMLQQLRHPYAVASGADTDKMRLTLGRTKLLPFFEQRLFSASMVERSKPAPDVYLLAAKTLGVAPQRCVVIEDTATGTSAGVAAGMTVFGYCERQDPRQLLAAGASAIFNDMRRLPMLLG
jgi:HAD superfamily hydrolase (TIGR01509 family)